MCILWYGFLSYHETSTLAGHFPERYELCRLIPRIFFLYVEVRLLNWRKQLQKGIACHLSKVTVDEEHLVIDPYSFMNFAFTVA